MLPANVAAAVAAGHTSSTGRDRREKAMLALAVASTGSPHQVAASMPVRQAMTAPRSPPANANPNFNPVNCVIRPVSRNPERQPEKRNSPASVRSRGSQAAVSSPVASAGFRVIRFSPAGARTHQATPTATPAAAEPGNQCQGSRGRPLL